MNKRCLQLRWLKCFLLVLAINTGAVMGHNPGLGNKVHYVRGGGANWIQFDIWVRDLDTGIATQLTDNPAIDNHPASNATGEWMVWSSTRGGDEFNLFLADLADVENTVRQLTFNDDFPDRHPHFCPTDPRLLVWSSKDQELEWPIEVVGECSVPTIIEPPRKFERINMMRLNADGTAGITFPLDIRDAWDQNADPDIWTPNTGSYVGHPSFSPDGNRILFSGSHDGAGAVWEVYTVEIKVELEPLSLGLIPGSLRRVTDGPAVGPNPIQMSGGAHYSADGTEILFSSTRTDRGNSQIFSVPADAVDVPVTAATQLTDHNGNDYVPTPLSGETFVVTSDLGPWPLCGTDDPDELGPSDSLTITLVDPDADTREDLTDDSSIDEMLLIADEVSWFCGLKPNLSACTYQPRIFDVESLWLMRSAFRFMQGEDVPLMPSNLLGYHGYPYQAFRLYALAWLNMESFMLWRGPWEGPFPWDEAIGQIALLENSDFPGFEDPAALQVWFDNTRSLRRQKFVLPSIMYDHGIGAELPPVPRLHLRSPWPGIFYVEYPAYWVDQELTLTDRLGDPTGSPWRNVDELLPFPEFYSHRGVNRLALFMMAGEPALMSSLFFRTRRSHPPWPWQELAKSGSGSNRYTEGAISGRFLIYVIDVDTNVVPPGRHNIEIQYTDGKGNPGKYIQSFTLDANGNADVKTSLRIADPPDGLRTITKVGISINPNP